MSVNKAFAFQRSRGGIVPAPFIGPVLPEAGRVPYGSENPGGVVRIGVIGYGHWGPNIVRNLHGVEACHVTAVCDRSPAALRRAHRLYPQLQLTGDAADVLAATDIDAVAIVTPARSHFELAKAALMNGKHVFIEKPVTSTSRQAEELIELAERHHLQIMVDHTFLFGGPVRKIRELVTNGTLGPLYYYDSTRVNLGLFRHDINVVWDLAAHDFSIMDHVLAERPEAVVATGARHVNGVADVAFITVYFPNDIVAHINVSWLSPVKVRTTLIGGRDKMLVWNDLEAEEKIRVYDKGVDIEESQGGFDVSVSYRSGDVWSPRLQQTEALKLELEYFAECIQHNRTPLNDGHAGLRVVRLLEAADRSLTERGRAITC